MIHVYPLPYGNDGEKKFGERHTGHCERGWTLALKVVCVLSGNRYNNCSVGGEARSQILLGYAKASFAFEARRALRSTSREEDPAPVRLRVPHRGAQLIPPFS